MNAALWVGIPEMEADWFILNTHAWYLFFLFSEPRTKL